MSFTEYESLSDELKNEIKLNSEKNKNLKVGFYSKSYTVVNNGKTYKYRFHCISNSNNENHYTIIFNGNSKPHKNKILENDNILFYDHELQCSLKLVKEIFEQELVDMNLSPEQKTLLAEGNDITLNVSHNKATSNHLGNMISSMKNMTKTFSADYGYFMGKNTLFLREKHISKTLKISKL